MPTIPATDGAATPAPDPRRVPLLRWTFRKGPDTVVCELSLDVDHTSYEIRVEPPDNPTGVASERFDDAVAAFQRHGTIERTLVSAGWSLDGFESTR